MDVKTHDFRYLVAASVYIKCQFHIHVEAKHVDPQVDAYESSTDGIVQSPGDTLAILCEYHEHTAKHHGDILSFQTVCCLINAIWREHEQDGRRSAYQNDGSDR